MILWKKMSIRVGNAPPYHSLKLPANPSIRLVRLTVAGHARTERSIMNVTQHDVECPKIDLGGC